MSSKKFLQFFLGTTIGLFSFSIFAQDEGSAATDEAVEGELFEQPPQAKKAPGKETGVLDFEGETIEGQKKRPELFLQTEVQNLTLDAILYLRKDFNDFHQVDRNRRPGYIERKTRRRK